MPTGLAHHLAPTAALSVFMGMDSLEGRKPSTGPSTTATGEELE